MNKLKLTIIGLILLFITLIFIIVTFLIPNPPSPQNPSIPNPTGSSFKEGELYIISIKPQDTERNYLPVQPVEISFTLPVSKDKISYITEPQVDTFTTNGNDANTIIISPTTIWQTGKTTIKIINAVSATGKALSNPQSYILETSVPTIPEDLEGAY